MYIEIQCAYTKKKEKDLKEKDIRQLNLLKV